jgi:RND superfamily putative drug exporter
VGSTGGVITAAGVIFAASMFGMLFASISTLVQAGFIIGIGLLLDTFLVRTITVPAIAVLVGKANWWPSRLPPPEPRSREVRLPVPESGSTSEAPNDTAQDPGGRQHSRVPAEVAADTDPDTVALRS